jgi:hypothetical protein
VGVFFGLGKLLLVRVTSITDVVSLCYQHLGKVALVGIMAGAAAAFGDRGVNKSIIDQFGLVMAKKAEVIASSPELELIG